eukprot:scaffold168_cov64-Phaeocystis_antarctica.AAC.3
MSPVPLITSSLKQCFACRIQLGTYEPHGERGRQHCGQGRCVSTQGGGIGHLVTQLAPVSGCVSVSVEHLDVTRDGYDCYGRFASPAARLRLYSGNFSLQWIMRQYM